MWQWNEEISTVSVHHLHLSHQPLQRTPSDVLVANCCRLHVREAEGKETERESWTRKRHAKRGGDGEAWWSSPCVLQIGCLVVCTDGGLRGLLLTGILNDILGVRKWLSCRLKHRERNYHFWSLSLEHAQSLETCHSPTTALRSLAPLSRTRHCAEGPNDGDCFLLLSCSYSLCMLDQCKLYLSKPICLHNRSRGTVVLSLCSTSQAARSADLKWVWSKHLAE